MHLSDVSSILVALSIYALGVPFPGPSMIHVCRTSIVSGPRAGAAAALGTTLGTVIYAALTLLGLSTLLNVLPWLLTLIQAAGGAYLVYLGLGLIRAHMQSRGRSARVDRSVDDTGGSRQSPREALLKGFYVSIGNPKTAAFFFGLFAPVAGESDKLPVQLVILGGIVIIDLVFHQTLSRAVVVASRSFIGRPVGKWFDAIAGSVMAVFGAILLAKAISR